MPTMKCKTCGNDFYAKPNWIKKGWGKYCSIKCQHESLKNGRFVECFLCKKKIYRTLKNLKRSKSKKYFCSKSCQTIWRNSIIYIGSNHSNWKGGGSIYRDILLRQNRPQICKRCGIRDERLLAVHHIDRNRNNSRVENLIWLCYNCHHLVHHNIKENQKLMETLV